MSQGSTDHRPGGKPKSPHAQLVHALEARGVDAVLDVGANVGQYAERLRRHGWRGPILSFEPLPGPHAELERLAANDPAWEIAPRMAIGAEDGSSVIERSAESDMSSILAQGAELAAISPSSRIVERIETPVRRLDSLPALLARPWRRMLLKADVQGYEKAVIEGASGLWERICGAQLELSFEPLYQGEPDWLEMIASMAERGHRPKLALPGYYERKRARQLQIDIVFFSEQAP